MFTFGNLHGNKNKISLIRKLLRISISFLVHYPIVVNDNKLIIPA